MKATPLIPLFFLTGETTTLSPVANETNLGVGLVAGFFQRIVPALLFLAIISMLFGFIRNISGKGGLRYAVAIAVTVGVGLNFIMPIIPLAHASSNVYSVSVSNAGWYHVNGEYQVIDAYGDPINYYFNPTSGDIVPAGTIFHLPTAGKYYLVPTSDQGDSSILHQYITGPDVSQYTYKKDADSDDYQSIDYNLTEDNGFGINYSDLYSNITYDTYTFIQRGGGTNGYTYAYFYNGIVFTGQFPYSETISLHGSITYSDNDQADDWAEAETDIYVLLDGSQVYNAELTGSNPSGTFPWQYNVNVTSGQHTIKVYYKVKVYGASGKTYDVDYTANINLYAPSATGDIPQLVTLTPVEEPEITVKQESSTVKVYANNFTIATHGDQEYNYYVVPVDTSEVGQLTSLNPVILEHQTNVIRPCRLVTIANQSYIIFQSWSTGTNNSYTVIWNYPNAPVLQDVFVDAFTSDPLMTWEESVKTNVSKVTVHDGYLTVEGENYEYMLARNLDMGLNGGLAYVKADYNGFWVGGNNVTYLTFMTGTPWLYFAGGELYKVELESTTDTITLDMQGVISYANYTSGGTIGILASGSSTAVLGGVIAVPETTGYNVTYNKQLLRLSIDIEKYSIGYSLPQDKGYWTHMVQVVVNYDPTVLPPIDYFNVRLELPEQTWVSENLARPGLTDIAITDSNGNLVPFWVEPYQESNGYRGVWVKLPADTSRNMYVLNILLNNTMLDTSLSTLNAFIQYYYKPYGLGSQWSKDGQGYIVTQSLYTNVMVLVPDSSNYTFKLALTPYDYYTVNPYGVTEYHSAWSNQTHSFNGLFIQNAVQWIYYTRDGFLKYYQANNNLWNVDDMNKPWSWPPVIIGATGASTIGLAVLVPYSYSIGTIAGGHWDTGDTQTVTVGGSGSSGGSVDWKQIGGMTLAMVPLLVIGLFFRLLERPPGVSKTVSGGGIL